MVQKIVDFLHAKKALILTATGLVLVYLVSVNSISTPLAVLFQGILSLFGSVADVATKQVGVSQKTNLGK